MSVHFGVKLYQIQTLTHDRIVQSTTFYAAAAAAAGNVYFNRPFFMVECVPYDL